jgi:hypothetical protein
VPVVPLVPLLKETVESVFSSSEIAEQAVKIAKDEELDIDERNITAMRVGRTLAKLRLTEKPRPGGIGSRKRGISLRELNRLAASYSLDLPDQLVLRDETNLNDQGHSNSGTYGTNGSNGTGSSTAEQSEQLAISPLSQPEMSGETAEGVEKCYACGTTNWRSHPDGSGRFCATCHP